MDVSSQATLCTSLFLVVVMVTLTPEVTAGGTTPVLFARGTHYQVGEQMGNATKKQISKALDVYQELLEGLMVFNQTTRGQQLYSSLLVAAETHYPQYVDELRGLAAGAGVPFDTIFLLNIRHELEIDLMLNMSHGDGAPPSGGCSEFMVNNEDWALHLHSEDAPPEIPDLSVIWVIEVMDEDDQVTESLIGYAYPGMAPGSCWTLNSHGVMFGGNIVVPRTAVSDKAVPRRLANRALLTATSIDDFITRIVKLPDFGSGFNYMLSERVCTDNTPDCILQLGIELVNNGTGRNMVHIHQVADFDSHFNEYEYMAVEQLHDPSSRYRRESLEQYKQQLGGSLTTFSQLTHIISDQHNTEFPLYRDGTPPDYLITESIAIADFYHNKLYVYKDKPTQASPEVTFHLRPWHGTPVNLEERMVDPEPFTQPQTKEVHEEECGGDRKDEL